MPGAASRPALGAAGDAVPFGPVAAVAADTKEGSDSEASEVGASEVGALEVGAADRAADGPPVSLLAQLDALEAMVDAVTSVDPAEASGVVAAEASRRMRRVVDRLAAQRWGWIGRVEVDGSWAVETMQSFGPWLEWKEELSPALARRTVATARALRDHLPATASAARAGAISAEHVGLMVKTTTSEALRAALACPVTTHSPDPAGAAELHQPDASLAAADFAAEMSVDVSMDDAHTGTGAGTDADADADSEADAGTDADPRPSGRLCTGEEMLLGLAGARRVGEFAKVAKYFTVVCDPEAQDKAFKDAAEREFLQLSPTLGGVQVSGFLTSEHGQLLTVALRAVAGVPAAGTVHTVDVRHVDALVDLAQLFLDGGIAGKGAAVRPHLSVHIGWDQYTRLLHTTEPHTTGPHTAEPHASETIASTAVTGPSTLSASSTCSSSSAWPTPAPQPAGTWFPDPSPTPRWSPDQVEAQLRAGPATWEDGTGPIPEQVLRRIICDCDTTRIIFGPESQILNVGRTQRTFTKELRRAIVARDRHCTWPGCDIPPRACEVHHATRHWADGGTTTPSNGALLCRRHHHQVDADAIAMTYANGWTFHPPGSYQPSSQPDAGECGTDHPDAGRPDCSGRSGDHPTCPETSA